MSKDEIKSREFNKLTGEHVGEDVHGEKAELGTEYIFTQLSRHTGLGGKERESWRFSEHEGYRGWPELSNFRPFS